MNTDTFDKGLMKEQIKIAICSEERNSRDELKRLIKGVMPLAELCAYASAEGVLADIKIASKCPKILFLDIGNENESRIRLADSISKEKEKAGQSILSGIPLIIFVTDHAGYVKDAMNVHAFAYLEKPVRISRMADVLKSAVRELGLYEGKGDLPRDSGQKGAFLMARTGTEVRRLPIAGILYIESMSRKVIVKLVDEEIIYYDKISSLESALGKGFFRIHRSYIVSFRYVVRYSRTEVELANGEKLPVSKYRYADFTAAFAEYMI